MSDQRKRPKIIEETATKANSSRDSKTSTLVGGIPVCVWAKALDLLTHDDLLRCSTVCRSFTKDVSPLVSCIMISPNAPPNALKYFPYQRFPNVQNIYVYNAIREIGDHAAMGRAIMDEWRWRATSEGLAVSMADVNCATIEAQEQVREFKVIEDVGAIANFLGLFPKLETAFVGGLCTCAKPRGPPYNTHQCWNGEKVRIDLGFNPQSIHGKGRWGISYMEKQQRLVEEISLAYYHGRLDESVCVSGILPGGPCGEGEEIACPWKELIIMENQQDDEESDEDDDADDAADARPCKSCRRICSFFPVETVFQLNDYQVPCIGMKERIQIATRRSPQNAGKFLTSALRSTLARPCYNYMHLMSYENSGAIEFLATHGADVKDPSIRQTLLEQKEYVANAGMTEEAFMLLTRLGISITRADFNVVSDEEGKKKMEEIFKGMMAHWTVPGS